MNELLRQDAELQGNLSGLMLCALSNETDTEHYQELLTSAEKRIAELKRETERFSEVGSNGPCDDCFMWKAGGCPTACDRLTNYMNGEEYDYKYD